MCGKFIFWIFLIIGFAFAQINISFESPTPLNNSFSNSSLIINISINTSSMHSFLWSWNGTNYSQYDQFLLLQLNFDNISAIGDTATNITDVSQYNATGLCYDSTNTVSNCNYVSGKYGKALEFYGNSNERYEILDKDIYDGLNETTLVVWIYPRAGMSSWNGILSKGNDNFAGNSWSLNREGAGGDSDKIRFSVVDGAGAGDLYYSSETISSGYLNKWSYVAVSWNGSTKQAQFYKNGIADGSIQTGSNVAQIRSGSHNVWVGLSYSVPGWNGYVDEVKIYNRSLTSNEIFELYQSSLNKYSSDKWQFQIFKSNLDLGSYTFYACANDSINQNCTQQLVVNQGPSISNISSMPIDVFTFQIKWSTNGLTNSSVKYGISPNTLNQYSTDSILISQHNITLSSLSNDTLYYYNVTSCINQLCAEVGPYTFSTSLHEPILNILTPTPENNSIISISNPIINLSSSSYLYSCIIDGTTSDFGAGSGINGTLNVSSPNTIINFYAAVTQNVSSGSSSILISNSSGFNIGDEVLIIQMQNYSAGTSGTYEFGNISLISGNTITLSKPILNPYYSGSFNSSTATSAQIVSVPNFHTVIVSADASIVPLQWNGSIGGIIAFRASNAVLINGTINASSQGYRGGISGYSGESYTGTGALGTSANKGGGGGGFIPFGGWGDEANGGGGGYATYGGSGGVAWGGENGSIYGSNSQFFLLGSGGGGGGQTGGGASGGIGGAGGGIIFFTTASLVLVGNITSIGGFGTDNSNGGSSGGGSGGSVIIFANSTVLGSNLTNASGGLGGVGNGFPAGNGGAGGDGRIRIFSNQISGVTYPTYYSEGILSNFSYYMSISYTNFSNAIFQYNNLLSSSYPYNISCSNLNGNSTSTGIRSFIVDHSLPTINLVYPQNNTALANSSIQFLFNTSNDGSNTNCSIYLDGVLNQTNSSVLSNTNSFFNISAINQGLHYWNITCIDMLGNSNTSQTYAFVVDLAPPFITLNSPANNSAEVNSTVAFNFTVVDNDSSILNCSIYLDNVLNLTNSSPVNNTPTIFNISNIADGNHLWNVSCFDASNNIGNSSTYNFSVNTTPTNLSVTIISPNDGISQTGTDLNFVFNASGFANNIFACSLIIDDLVVLSNSSVINATETTLSGTALTVGLHSWFINCTDSNSNTKNSSTRSFSITKISSTSESSAPKLAMSVSSIANCTNSTLIFSSRGNVLDEVRVAVEGELIGYTTNGQISIPYCGKEVRLSASKASYEQIDKKLQLDTCSCIASNLQLKVINQSCPANQLTMQVSGTNDTVVISSILGSNTTDSNGTVTFTIDKNGTYSFNATANGSTGKLDIEYFVCSLVNITNSSTNEPSTFPINNTLENETSHPTNIPSIQVSDETINLDNPPDSNSPIDTTTPVTVTFITVVLLTLAARAFIRTK